MAARRPNTKHVRTSRQQHELIAQRLTTSNTHLPNPHYQSLEDSLAKDQVQFPSIISAPIIFIIPTHVVYATETPCPPRPPAQRSSTQTKICSHKSTNSNNNANSLIVTVGLTWTPPWASVSAPFHTHSGSAASSAYAHPWASSHGHANGRHTRAPSCRLPSRSPAPSRCRNPTTMRTTRRWTRLRLLVCGICSKLEAAVSTPDALSNEKKRWRKAQPFPGRECSPLELFLPKPSLSTTSSAHCTDRPLALWPPRRRKMRCVSVCGPVCVCVWDVDGAGAARWRCLSVMVVVACTGSAASGLRPLLGGVASLIR